MQEQVGGRGYRRRGDRAWRRRLRRVCRRLRRRAGRGLRRRDDRLDLVVHGVVGAVRYGVADLQVLQLGHDVVGATRAIAPHGDVHPVRCVPAGAVRWEAHLHDPRPDLLGRGVDGDGSGRRPQRTRHDLVAGQRQARLVLSRASATAEALERQDAGGRRQDCRRCCRALVHRASLVGPAQSTPCRPRLERAACRARGRRAAARGHRDGREKGRPGREARPALQEGAAGHAAGAAGRRPPHIVKDPMSMPRFQMPIIPMSSCSRMWQWNMDMPV